MSFILSCRMNFGVDVPGKGIRELAQMARMDAAERDVERVLEKVKKELAEKDQNE